MRVTEFFAACDLCVVDVNPEMADMANPRGEIHGYASFVYATFERGDRRRLFVKSSRWEDEAIAPADTLARALMARLANGKLPVGFDRWEECRPCYGSPAYIEYGQEDDLMLERKEAEEEAWG